MRVHINTVTTFNRVIDFFNSYMEAQEKAEEDPEITFQDATADIETRPMQVIDVQFQIILAGLKKAGERAIQLKDEELISHLQAIGILGISNKEESP